jgi:hypothetical protein
MSWNSTHTALASLAAIVITGFHYGVNLEQLVPIIAPLGAYIALREASRVKNSN